MPSNHLILFALFFFGLQSFPASGSFSNELAVCIREPKYLSFSFSISPHKYSGLISFRIDRFDLLAVKGTLKESYPASPFKSINSSVLCLLYGPTLTSIHDTGKTIALTRWTFVGSTMSLLFNMLSVLGITFLPRSKRLNFMAAITICSDFGAQENKSVSLFPHLFATK